MITSSLDKKIKYHRWAIPVIGYVLNQKVSITICKTCMLLMPKKISDDKITKRSEI